MNSKKKNQEIATAVSPTQQTSKREEKSSEEDYIPYTVQCEVFR
jgi:hypothetical protein